MGDAGVDGLVRHLPAVGVEKRQFSAGFGKPAREIAPLRLTRPRKRRIACFLMGWAFVLPALADATHDGYRTS
jgi:hypothetical protein